MKNTEAILVTPKQFEIQECPVPEPKDNEILMKVEYVGMCGSDIHGFEFGPFIPPKDPNQKIGLGHEVAGEVVKVGAAVTKFKAGDKVLIEPGVPDDTCEYCRTGRYNICPDVDFMATQPNYRGALTEYMVHPEDWTYRRNTRKEHCDPRCRGYRPYDTSGMPLARSNRHHCRRRYAETS